MYDGENDGVLSLDILTVRLEHFGCTLLPEELKTLQHYVITHTYRNDTGNIHIRQVLALVRSYLTTLAKQNEVQISGCNVQRNTVGGMRASKAKLKQRRPRSAATSNFGGRTPTPSFNPLTSQSRKKSRAQSATATATTMQQMKQASLEGQTDEQTRRPVAFGSAAVRLAAPAGVSCGSGGMPKPSEGMGWVRIIQGAQDGNWHQSRRKLQGAHEPMTSARCRHRLPASVGPDSYYDPKKEANRWLHGPAAFGQGSAKGRMRNEFESIVTKRAFFKTPKDRLTDHKQADRMVGKILDCTINRLYSLHTVLGGEDRQGAAGAEGGLRILRQHEHGRCSL
jgi:hypothetical protein